MRKLVHSDFEIPLSNRKISDTTENSSFSDTFFSRIQFPFEIAIDDLDEAVGFISAYNSNPQTLYPVKYVDGDSISDAVFEILEAMGSKLQCTFEAGAEEFPNWKKKLAELPLHKFDLPEGTTIYEYAEGMVNSVYPEVDFCFAALHTDRYAAEAGTSWEDFEGIINNYKDGHFLVNTVDGMNISHTRNIMQPLPYLLYVLKRGFEDAGKQLTGEILNDERLQRSAIYAAVDHFVKKDAVVREIYKDFLAYEELLYFINGNWIASYQVVIDIEQLGDYALFGTIASANVYPNNGSGMFAITFNGVLLASGDSNMFLNDVELSFTTNPTGPNQLVIYAETSLNENTPVFDLQLVLADEFDDEGNGLPEVRNLNAIELAKAVPDMEFGELVTTIKNWFNYDFTVTGDFVVMNKNLSNLKPVNVVDLRSLEIRNPTRKFKKGVSFLLKFSDIESKDYKYEPVFQNAAGVVFKDFVPDNKTNTIDVNALPLPLLERHDIKTGHAFEDNDSKLYLVQYAGLRSDKNSTLPPQELLMPSVHLASWYSWMLYRINSVGFKWIFKIHWLQQQGLSVKRMIYAYNHNHLIKTMTRTEIAPGLYEIELETEALH